MTKFSFSTMCLTLLLSSATWCMMHRPLPKAEAKRRLFEAIWASTIQELHDFYPETLKQLINEPDLLSQETPLHNAIIRHCDNKVIEKLIELGADVTKPGPNNITALHYAITRSLPDCVRILLAHGANIEAPDNHGNTPLILLANTPGLIIGNRGLQPVLEKMNIMYKLLLAKNPNRNAKNNKGESFFSILEENFNSLTEKAAQPGSFTRFKLTAITMLRTLSFPLLVPAINDTLHELDFLPDEMKQEIFSHVEHAFSATDKTIAS